MQIILLRHRKLTTTTLILVDIGDNTIPCDHTICSSVMLLFTVAISDQISQSTHFLKVVEDLLPYPGVFALFSVCCIYYSLPMR